MTPKVTPTKKVKRFERYICNGRLRVQINDDEGEVSEIIVMSKKGGCKYNLQLIGRLMTGMLECNIDPNYIVSILDDNDPCPATTMRMKRENLPREECGVGGCSKVLLEAFKAKIEKLSPTSK